EGRSEISSSGGDMRALIVLGLVTLGAGPVAAQSIAERIASVPDGSVRMSYAARAGVCGQGDNISIRSGQDAEWQSECDDGPVRLSLTVRDGKVVGIKARVGGRWRGGIPGTDLGAVGARQAADYLLDLAESGGPAAKDAIFPAMIADSVTPWPALLRIARNRRAHTESRKAAIFWLGQEAGSTIVPALDALASGNDEREVKQAAIFAISRRPADEAVP